jgi:hypothetical protein
MKKSTYQPLQEERFEREEVAGPDARRLLAQELSPAQRLPLLRWRDAAFFSTFRTVVAETSSPSCCSSPTMRR